MALVVTVNPCPLGLLQNTLQLVNHSSFVAITSQSQQGPVLLLNGDQPLVQLKEQLEEMDFPITDQTLIQTDWQLQRYAQFIKLMEKHRPKLVVIDSLDWLLWWSSL